MILKVEFTENAKHGAKWRMAILYFYCIQESRQQRKLRKSSISSKKRWHFFTIIKTNYVSQRSRNHDFNYRTIKKTGCSHNIGPYSYSETFDLWGRCNKVV